MKISVFFFFIFQFIYCQNIEATYSIKEYYTINPNDYDDQMLVNVLKRRESLIKKNTENLLINIICSRNQYYFSAPDKMSSDNRTISNSSIVYNLLRLKQNVLYANGSTFYFNNHHPFVTKLDVKTVKWQIFNETKIINGLECLKAVPLINKDNSYHKLLDGLEVWFSPKINYVGGPTYFANLPGLIITLKTDFVKFQLIDIKETNNKIPDTIEFLNKKNIKTFDESEKYYAEIRNNLLETTRN